MDNGTIEAPWKAKAAIKRAAEAAKIPQEWRLAPEYLTGNEKSDISVVDIPAKCGILSPAEVEITERYSAVALGRAVQTGQITASAVALAFCKRAAIAQQLTNCLTETFFEDALKRGRYLDDFLAEHKRPVGPLHGVPVSLKDMMNYKGVASTLGIISFLDHPVADQNAPLVDILLQLGAILYCKTNIPQTMMTADSDNNVFGKTLNPHRLSLTAGGSSGGEGALVAMRGSILGIGTDIGGSIRIPALCCGTYGFKPSPHRIPYGGFAAVSRRGSPGFPSVAGPLANSYEDLSFLVQNVIAAKPWDLDATAIPFPWRAEVANSTPASLRVGYFIEYPTYKVSPPVIRTLEEAAKKLTAAGVTVFPLTTLPSMTEAATLMSDSFSFDNARTAVKHIQAGGEPLVPSVVNVGSKLKRKPDDYTVDDIFDHNVAKVVYKNAWNRVFVENALDVILCPGAGHTALPHDQYGLPPYTAIFNLLEVKSAMFRVLLFHN